VHSAQPSRLPSQLTPRARRCPLSLTPGPRSSAATSRPRPSPTRGRTRVRPSHESVLGPVSQRPIRRLFRPPPRLVGSPVSPSTLAPAAAAPNPSRQRCRHPSPPPSLTRASAAGSSLWCCSVEPPLGKGPARVTCLGARAPRIRPVFTGAPPPRLLVVRPPRLAVASLGARRGVRRALLVVLVLFSPLLVHRSAGSL
jgi:hypothetical protein